MVVLHVASYVTHVPSHPTTGIVARFPVATRLCMIVSRAIALSRCRSYAPFVISVLQPTTLPRTPITMI